MEKSNSSWGLPPGSWPGASPPSGSGCCSGASMARKAAVGWWRGGGRARARPSPGPSPWGDGGAGSGKGAGSGAERWRGPCPRGDARGPGDGALAQRVLDAPGELSGGGGGASFLLREAPVAARGGGGGDRAAGPAGAGPPAGPRGRERGRGRRAGRRPGGRRPPAGRGRTTGAPRRATARDHRRALPGGRAATCRLPPSLPAGRQRPCRTRDLDGKAPATCSCALNDQLIHSFPSFLLAGGEGGGAPIPFRRRLRLQGWSLGAHSCGMTFTYRSVTCRSLNAVSQDPGKNARYSESEAPP